MCLLASAAHFDLIEAGTIARKAVLRVKLAGLGLARAKACPKGADLAGRPAAAEAAPAFRAVVTRWLVTSALLFASLLGVG